MLGGTILGSREYIRGPVQTFLRNTGSSVSPFNAWLLLKGLKTMSLRVRAQTAAALRLAPWLETQPGIAGVRYPFLASHPQHELARAQMCGGGTVVTFDLAPSGGTALGGTTPKPAKQATFAFLDAPEVIDISNNLGDAESLVTHPATTTHRKLGPAGRAAVGIAETTVRLSVGLEDPLDLIDDLERALRTVYG